MTKQEFLSALKKRLSRMPEEDRLRTLDYYKEMIEDRMEEGLSEEKAVKDLGALEDIVTQCLQDAPKKQKKNPATIVLLILGFPVWFSVLAALAAVALSVVISLFAIAITLAASAVGGTLGGGILLCNPDNTYSGVFLLGSGLTCGGLAVFAFPLARSAVKGCIRLVKKLCRKETKP